MIVDGDETTLIESDDLLQCDSAYGGLLTEGGSEYSFTYFPEEGIRVKWEVVLQRGDIERVANGELKELTLWGCRDSGCGCKFYNENDTCFYCDWVEGPDEA